MRSATSIIKIGLGTIALLLVVGYGYRELHGLASGPQLTIGAPANGVSVENEEINLTGKSTNIASLEVNGHQIFTDTEGNFKEKLLLLDGYNVIEVRATDKFKRTTVKRLELVLLSSPTTIATAPTAVARFR